MNLDAMKRDLDTKRADIQSLHTAQLAAAHADGDRARTAEEIAALEGKLSDARQLKARIAGAQVDAEMTSEIAGLTAGLALPAAPTQTTGLVAPLRSIGQQLVETPDYAGFLKTGMHRRSGSWISPSMELDLSAATLDTTGGSGGTLIQPYVVPGIKELFFRKLMIEDLLASGTVDSNVIQYLRETTFTNSAAPVLEGGIKPESTLIFAQAVSPVQKIAHWLPVTEEMLEDFSAIRSYIDARLMLGLALTREDQILNGSGTPPALRGIMNTVGLTPAQLRGTDSNMDAIFKQITTITSVALIQPDGIVMNPINWQNVQLAKNANGNYMGSGPWAGPQPTTLWGYPVAVTPAMPAGTALVGAFQTCAQIFYKGGVRLEITNSHNDFFVKNLIAIRCEQRLALVVYRPAGFGTVTGLA